MLQVTFVISLQYEDRYNFCGAAIDGKFFCPKSSFVAPTIPVSVKIMKSLISEFIPCMCHHCLLYLLLSFLPILLFTLLFLTFFFLNSTLYLLFFNFFLYTYFNLSFPLFLLSLNFYYFFSFFFYLFSLTLSSIFFYILSLLYFFNP